jgi:DNA polymerase-3 subunit epsilon
MLKENLQRIYDKLQKPVVFLDLETTGLEAVSNDIIQLYIYTYDGFKESEFYKTYNTDVKMDQKAIDKHKLRNEDLVGLDYFKVDAEFIFRTYFKQDSIICGYNSNRFDIPFFVEQFMKAGIEDAHIIANMDTVDVYKIYTQLYPNSLEGVYKRLLKKEISEAHDAKWDVHATIEVLDHLLINVDDESTPEGFTWSDSGDNFLDVGKKFIRDEEGNICFNFGSNKGKKIKDMDKKEVIDYLDWMLKVDMPGHTKTICKKIKAKLQRQ